MEYTHLTTNGTPVDDWQVKQSPDSPKGELDTLRFWECPVLYDINNDGKLEIIVSGYPPDLGNGNTKGEIIILNNSGQIIHLKYPLTMNYPASVAVGDINNGNKPEIVAVDILGTVYAWNYTGEPFENWPSNAFADSMSRYVSPVLGDINNDGYLEIIVSKSWLDGGFITVFDYQGNMLDNWPKRTSSIWQPPALSDMDNDGKLDIILNTDYPYNFYVFNYLGEENPVFSRDIGSTHSPLITDLDGDAKSDIVAIASVENSLDYELYAWDNSGEMISGFPLLPKTRGGTPVLGDFDNDGLVEIVFAANNGDNDPVTLYYWDLKFPFNKELTTWQTYRHDNWRTGSYNTQTTTGIKAENNPHIVNFHISNYPNPFNINTVIEFTVPEKDNYTINIYNILGSEISTIYDGILNPGKYNFPFSGSELSSGVYILKANSSNYSTSRKIILLK